MKKVLPFLMLILSLLAPMTARAQGFSVAVAKIEKRCLKAVDEKDDKNVPFPGHIIFYRNYYNNTSKRSVEEFWTVNRSMLFQRLNFPSNLEDGGVFLSPDRLLTYDRKNEELHLWNQNGDKLGILRLPMPFSSIVSLYQGDQFAADFTSETIANNGFYLVTYKPSNLGQPFTIQRFDGFSWPLPINRDGNIRLARGFIPSPDTQVVVYHSERIEEDIPSGWERGLILADVKTHRIIWKTQFNLFWDSPIWSPDSTRFVFQRYDRLDYHGWLPHELQAEMALVDRQGNERIVTDFNNTATYATFEPMVWSPNSNKIVFWLRRYQAKSEISISPKSRHLYMLDVKDNVIYDFCYEIPETYLSDFVWSPNSRYFTFFDASRGLTVVDADQLRMITLPLYDLNPTAWSSK